MLVHLHVLTRVRVLCSFSKVPALMQGKDNRRVIGLYNRLARALLEFEGLWLRAWRKGLDVCLQGLQAPLIVRHPETGARVGVCRCIMACVCACSFLLSVVELVTAGG